MSWYSWWTGKVGPRKKKTHVERESQESEAKQQEQRVALIVGVTGIVGASLAEILPGDDTPGGPWKVYGVARREKPAWLSQTPLLQYIQCDVLDRAQTLEKISSFIDVTHLFWVAWLNRPTEEENCTANGFMLQNVLDALLPHALNFQHICLQTGGKHYKGPFNLVGKIQTQEDPFHEELPRLPVPNFYYTLEDIVYDAVKKKEGLTWSIHRPGPILGFSPTSLMNILGSLAVYALICKKEGLPFRFPGNLLTWEKLSDASDAELIAEQEIWAATDPNGQNEAFNITNGDLFKFKHTWGIFADEFGLEVPAYDGVSFSLEETMRDKGSVWDAIVAEHGLLPTKLDDVGNWWFADLMLNASASSVLSMNKSKESGFFGFRNTEASIKYWIERMREKKIIA